MEILLDKIKNFLKNVSPKFWIKIGIFAVLFIFLAFVQANSNKNAKQAENGDNKAKVTEKADSSKSAEPTSTATPEVTYAPITPDPDEKSEGHGDEWDASQDVQSTKVDSTKAVECKTSDVDSELEKIMTNDGRFVTDTTTDYVKRDLTRYADQDPVYNNMYLYTGTVSYAKDTTITIGDNEIDKGEGDTAYLKAYVTQDGDNATIHELIIDGNILIDDGQVPAEEDYQE